MDKCYLYSFKQNLFNSGQLLANSGIVIVVINKNDFFDQVSGGPFQYGYLNGKLRVIIAIHYGLTIIIFLTTVRSKVLLGSSLNVMITLTSGSGSFPDFVQSTCLHCAFL